MCYFACAINSDREETIRESLKVLEVHKDEFDAIAFIGISGACIAPILAYHLGKELIPIRKPTTCGEHSHGSAGVVRIWQPKPPSLRVILVDDFICSGKTARHMTNEIIRWSERAKVVAIFVYKPYSSQYPVPDKTSITGLQHWYWQR
jgi:adenine/guanine phosphoribosyltransferase-like PRPP-binding protein